MAKGIAKLAVVAVIILSQSQLHAHKSGEPNDMVSMANGFLSALLARDHVAMRRYVADESRFFGSNGLQEDIAKFLYVSKGNKKSVLDIAALGRIEYKFIPQADGRVLVLFFPAQDRKLIDGDLGYLKKRWMDRYFACEFESSAKIFAMADNFCFAETGGPFHE